MNDGVRGSAWWRWLVGLAALLVVGLGGVYRFGSDLAILGHMPWGDEVERGRMSDRGDKADGGSRPDQGDRAERGGGGEKGKQAGTKG
ncbi:MAG: hypothetical protein HQL63_15935, partial [Magnetococcales bacterium]|nr:hypothetical protein [Magnetococcales bacterium]